MPTKAGKLSKKGVIISMYVERPTKRSNIIHRYYFRQNIVQNQHHHDQRGNKNIAAGKGLNRRAELLLYSRLLRDSAPPNSIVSAILSPPTNVNAVQRKPKHHNEAPACPVNWKTFNIGFCRSLASVQINKGSKKKNQTGSSTKSVIKSLEVTKKKGFVSRFLSKLQKHP